MFIAVDGFKNNPHEIGKYLGIFLGVVVFILCGFEHCIANMVYLFAGKCDAPVMDQVLFIALVTLGNSLGSIAFHRCRKIAA